jgi:aspartyl aminopeptidase
MKDRFDLEDEIYQISNLAEHINNILAQQEHLTQDEQQNALIGISQLIKIQTTILIDTMSQVLHLDQYSNNPNTHNSD